MRVHSMAQQNYYKANLRDMTFLLFEQFHIEELVGKAPFANWGKDEIVHFGTAAQQQTYVPKMIDGTWAGTMCLTEPHAGSDVGSNSTQAVRRADGKYDLKGTKIFISGGDQDITDNIVHMVLARTPDAPPGTKGLSLFIVPKKRADGTSNDVAVAGIEHKMGIKASATAQLAFGDAGDR